jgi:hypothetical protein
MLAKIVKFNIKKPLYGNYVYLRGSIVEKAIRTGAMLEVTIPTGKMVVDPKVWRDTGKMIKKVFRYKDNPMVMYGNWVKIPIFYDCKIEEKKEEIETKKQSTLF